MHLEYAHSKSTSLFGKILYLRERLLINLVEWTKPIYKVMIQHTRKKWNHNQATLSDFPNRTMGKDLANFLERENFDLMPYYETHDLLHVLLHYQTTVVDEGRMQFFLLGNGKKSLYLYGTVALSLILLPEYWRSFREAYKRGQSSLDFSKWKFEHLLHEQTAVLRQMIFKDPIEEEIPLFI